jgi:tetratricopeptide (TPR) repeat protein
MRIAMMIGCMFMLSEVAPCPADEHPRTDSKVKLAGPDVAAVLREAREIALKQDKEQHYWTDRVLLYIGDLQVQAGDFEGALRSIRGSSYDYGRNAGLARLAEAIARNGKRERAFNTLRLLDSNHGWRQDYLEDDVQLRWIERLIESGELSRAGKAIEQLKVERYRPDGFRKLAVAYARSGDATRAAEQFTLADDAASDLKDEYDRARALWETAEAQLTVGNADAAKVTIRSLVGTAKFKDPGVKFAALQQCAVLAAKAKDEQTAHRLFRRAIEAHNAVNEMNKTNALTQIAVAQASVGYIDGALKTASMIKDSEGEAALYAIAVAQLNANDAEGAIRTAMSVKQLFQYRDDALHEIVDDRIARLDLKAALASAEKVDNPSRKAAAILRVASAHAKSGDRKTAADIAARIELAPRDWLLEVRKERFVYRDPRTWGVRYEDTGFSTNGSRRWSSQRAAEVAAAAMTLAQALGDKPSQSYAILFNQINTEEITRALARAHAASGDANEALAWAKQIGSSGKANPDDDRQAWAVQRRIHALVGIAEGILDRSSHIAPNTGP